MPKTGWETINMSPRDKAFYESRDSDEKAFYESMDSDEKEIKLKGSELIFYDLLEEKLDRIITILERQGSLRAG